MSALEIDTSVLRGIAGDLRGIADAVPKTPALDLAGSGSGSVATAAESFNMWAVITGTLLAGKIDQLAAVADAAAVEFDRLDQEAANAVGGQP